jgi:serine beta-lactamase-like protein LACTB, mitochondrial
MKTVKIISILFIAFSISEGCKKEETDIYYNRNFINEITAARKDIFFFMSVNYIPGGTFAVAKEGEIIYSEGFGTASKDLDVSVNRNTKFRIGEVSELFTALIYIKMVENGILHPDSTVQHYLPGLPGNSYKIPVRNLLDHTSGIRETYIGEEDTKGMNLPLQQGVSHFINDSLNAPPGIFELPSMFNYNLLGAIMEKTTGQSFDKILKEYLTDTLQLSSTLVDNPVITIKNRSDFYEYNHRASVRNATFRDLRFIAPSKGLLSNADDLVKFGNAILYNNYLKDVQKKNLFKPNMLLNNRPSGISNGWVIMRDRNGRRAYWKSGEVTGGGAALLIYPEEELIVAGTTNLSPLIEEIPIFNLASHFLSDSAVTDSNSPEEKKQK